MTHKDYPWKNIKHPAVQEGKSTASASSGYKKSALMPGSYITSYGEEFFKKNAKKAQKKRNAWKKPEKKFGNQTSYQDQAHGFDSSILRPKSRNPIE